MNCSPTPEAVEDLKRAAIDGLATRAWEGDARFFPRQDGHLYGPGKGQGAFHNGAARFRVLFGGRGSGKSAAGAQEALEFIRKGMAGAVLNPDFENFKTSTWPEFREWIPWERVIDNDQRIGMYGWEPRGPFTIHFANGAAVRCKGLKDPDAARGPNISWLWYDEGGRDKTGTAWQLAIVSVRIPGPEGEQPEAWVTTTPRGTRHWTAKQFIYQEIPEEVQAVLDEAGHTGALYEHFNSTIHDNRRNLDPLFYASMLTAYTGRFAQQELGGEVVDVAEGVVYDNFTVGNISTLAEYDKKRGVVELAYDDGFSTSPRVFLFIQRDDDGVVNVFDEIYHLRHLPATCIGEAKDKAKACGYDRFEIAVGDPSAVQLKAAMRQADIPARGAKCPVEESIKNLYRLIVDAEGKTRLRIHPRCKEFVREMSEDYRYPEGSKGGDGIKPVKECDHGPDAIRYWAWLRMRRK